MLWTEIPGYSNYLISTNRDIISKFSGNTMKPQTEKKNNSPRVRLIKDNADRRKDGRLRAGYVYVDKCFEEAYPFHWFNQLADDEMVKPLILDGIPEGLYYITSYGRVYSTHIHSFKEKRWDGETYHTMTSLTHNYKQKVIKVSTQVGRAFLPDYKPGLFILHKDETLPIEEIDNVNNLWCGTQVDNMRDASIKGRLVGYRKRGA